MVASAADNSGFPTIRIVGIFVLVLGLALAAYGLYRRLNLPPEPSRPGHSGFLEGEVSFDDVRQRNDDWFDSHKERNRAVFLSTGLMMGGFFLVFFGGGLIFVSSRRTHQGARAIVTGFSSAVATGMQQGRGSAGGTPRARLKELEDLRGDGLITQDEYQEKREEILKEL